MGVFWERMWDSQNCLILRYNYSNRNMNSSKRITLYLSRHVYVFELQAIADTGVGESWRLVAVEIGEPKGEMRRHTSRLVAENSCFAT
jgi:hypothetical protein